MPDPQATDSRGERWRKLFEERAAYVSEVKALAPEARELLAKGHSQEEVATIISERRRGISAKYRDLTHEPWRSLLAQRNAHRYDGDVLGPSVAYLRSRGYSWGQIIEAAAKPGGAEIVSALVNDIRQS